MGTIVYANAADKFLFLGVCACRRTLHVCGLRIRLEFAKLSIEEGAAVRKKVSHLRSDGN